MPASQPSLAQLIADSGINLGDERALLQYLRRHRHWPCPATPRWRAALLDAYNLRQGYKLARAAGAIIRQQLAEIRQNAPAFVLGAAMGVVAFGVGYGTALVGVMQ